MQDILSAFRQNFPDSLIILTVFLTGWAALGLLLGRGIAGWFPFLLTSRFYLPIPGKRLPKLLISEETSHWGKTRPKYLHVKYYIVAPQNRRKMNLWGLLFYTTWLAFPLLLVLFAHQLPQRTYDLVYFLTLACPILTRLLAEQDYDRGFKKACQAEQKEWEEQEKRAQQEQAKTPPPE